jgi:hypothetical protein
VPARTKLAAEEKQRNAADFQAVAARDQGVRELVEDDREEQAEGADHRHPPVGRGRQIGMERREVAERQRPDHQDRQQHPGGVDPDLEAEQIEELELATEHDARRASLAVEVR